MSPILRSSHCTRSSTACMYYTPNRVLTFQHGPVLTEMAAESLGHSIVRSSLQVTSQPGLRAGRGLAGIAPGTDTSKKLSRVPSAVLPHPKPYGIGWDVPQCSPAHQYSAGPRACTPTSGLALPSAVWDEMGSGSITDGNSTSCTQEPVSTQARADKLPQGRYSLGTWCDQAEEVQGCEEISSTPCHPHQDNRLRARRCCMLSPATRCPQASRAPEGHHGSPAEPTGPESPQIQHPTPGEGKSAAV